MGNDSPWEQDFQMQREMQESRMHAWAGKQCLDRCTAHSDLFTNALLPSERGCLEECLAKRAQVSFIVAANVSKFEELEARKGAAAAAGKKGWF